MDEVSEGEIDGGKNRRMAWWRQWMSLWKNRV